MTRKPSYFKRAIAIFAMLFLTMSALTAISIRRGYSKGKVVDVGLLEQADHALFEGATQDKDQPFDFISAVNRIASKGVSPDENWGVIVFELAADDSDLPTKTRASYADHLAFDRSAEHRFRNLAEICQKVGTTEEVGTFEESLFSSNVDTFKNRDPNVEQFRKAIEFETPSIDRIVRELDKRPKYFVPMVRSNEGETMIAVSIPHVQTQRQFARWLRLRSSQNIADGDLNSAWRDIRALFQLGNRVSQGSFVVEFLVGAAIKTIAIEQLECLLNSSAIDKELLDDIANELPRVASLQPWTQALDRGERASLMNLLDQLMLGNASIFSPNGSNDGEVGLPMAWVDSVEVANQWNRMVDQLIDVSNANPEEQPRLFDELDEEVEGPIFEGSNLGWLLGKTAFGLTPRQEATDIFSNMLIKSFTPAFRVIQDASLRLLAQERNIRLAIAARQFELETQSLPNSLDSLIGKVPADVLVDPANGANLQIQWGVENDEEFDRLADLVPGTDGNAESNDTEQPRALRILSVGKPPLPKLWRIKLIPLNQLKANEAAKE